LIPDSVARDIPAYEQWGQKRQNMSIENMRFVATCRKEEIARKILAAIVELDLRSPELQYRDSYSWDDNTTIRRYTVKCYIPVELDYQLIENAIKRIVHGGENNQ
jgi:hypothetical protein